MGREKRGQEVGYPRWWELGEIGKKGQTRCTESSDPPPPLVDHQSASLVFEKVLTNDQLTFRIN